MGEKRDQRRFRLPSGAEEVRGSTHTHTHTQVCGPHGDMDSDTARPHPNPEAGHGVWET